jgi:hypothetical protein
VHLSKRRPLPLPRLSVPGIRPLHFHYFLGIFLLEEAVNAELGFALSVAIALLGAMAVHSRVLLAKGVPLGSARTLAVLGLVVLYQIPSSLSAPADCPVSPKFLATTLTFVLVAWSMWWLRPEPSIFSHAGTTWLLRWIAASLLLAQVGLDLMTILGNEPRIRSGFYSEPSHLALHLLPLVAYRLLHNFTDRLTWFTLALVMAFAPSSTLAMGLLGVGAIKLGMATRSRWFSVGLPLLAMGIMGALAASIDSISMLNRIAGVIYFDPDAITNLSSPVWLNGWSQSFDHFMASDGWGVGFNQMGCGALEMAGFLSPLLMRGEGFVVNSTDGSFLFAKIVAELGVLGMLACLYLTWLAIKAMLALSRGLDDSRPEALALRHDMICRAAAGLSLLVYLYVRGMSYFAFPTMLAVCVLLRAPARAQASSPTIS